jgi:intracellular septation protein
MNAPAPRRELAGWPKLAIELGPLLVFFLGYWRFDIFVATAAFMAATAAAVAASWWLTRHVPLITWVSAVLVGIFGGLTLWLQDETFIKVKPTVIFAGIGLLLAFASLSGRNYLRIVLATALPGLSPRGWSLLQARWAGFFLLLAAMNEVLWRTFPTDIWVHFKVWGDTLLTVLFAFAQFPLLKRHGLKVGDD